MYPHKLVIDSNRINAHGRSPDMTELGKYHQAGALELLITSTMTVEQTPGSSFANKAAEYQQVAGYEFHASTLFPAVTGPQSRRGNPVRPTLIGPLLKMFGSADINTVRDCLHIDQAQMNAADMFITNERKLLRAEALLAAHGVSMSICDADVALQVIHSYYRQSFGTVALEKVAAIAESQGPIVFGSCSCTKCTFVAERGYEELASIALVEGKVQIQAKFRGVDGELLLSVAPHLPPIYSEREARHPNSRLQVSGRGPIRICGEAVHSVVVTVDGETRLAARTTHTGRVVIYEMDLRDDVGTSVVNVQKEALVLSSVTVS